ncbi:Uncharacterised protein [Bordetella ansorpii]|uniref:HNH nuclease domain-containing protein n=1 Tax=Bordetella ansorpii TaxID=288768 RepID=A0A157SRB2_9BORD|nr:HNH endonuclease [Bordetella ansorpii]SAI72947.1 Uncharacterised protein [Bordetella ansorpii]
MASISKTDLLAELLDGVRAGGWVPFVLEEKHPFLLKATKANKSIEFRVYIWNCTHGGKSRARDEYRVQFTTMPRQRLQEKTLLLGWHDDTQVFAAWDITTHDNQDSISPSAQIKLSTLQAAHDGAFATQKKDNEIVVAFQPFLLIEYVQAFSLLHSSGKAHRDIALLDDLESLDDEEIAGISNKERRTVIATIKKKYRERSFREKVLQAYKNRCAFCRVQLGLLDAAHIIPVSAPGSTDEVVNGVALCKLHHLAYDTNLVAFDQDYKIKVSAARVRQLSNADLSGGLKGFKAALEGSLALPDNARHHPNRGYIRTSLRLRGWKP